jgi:hypothetical protein
MRKNYVRGTRGLLDAKLPSDLLLVFGELDLSETRLVWSSSNTANRMIEESDVPVRLLPEYTGLRWRVSNYPTAKPLYDDDWTRVTFDDGTVCDDHFFLRCLVGLQIGTAPFIAPWRRAAEIDGTAICAFSTVIPTTNCPFPFVNHKEPIVDVSSVTMRVSAIRDSDGFSIVSIYRDKNGSFRTIVEDL